MKFNKEEYENIKIPEQLNSIVQDAIEEGLTTESTGMSDQKPVNIYTKETYTALCRRGRSCNAFDICGSAECISDVCKGSSRYAVYRSCVSGIYLPGI